MAKKFAVPIDLQKLELLNARHQNLSSAPSSPVLGQGYFDTSLNKLGVYNGTTWDYMGTSTASGDVSSNAATSVDSEVAIFSGTGGKTIKRATITGLAKLTSGVLSAAVAGTDYVTGSSSNAFTNKTFDANGTGNSISNLEVADFASGVVDTSTSLGASDTKLPTQNAVKTYVDNAVQGLSWKTAVRVATTANGTLASAYQNGSTVDGITLVTGDRILIKDQTTGSENGIYTVNASGAPTRAADANTSAKIDSAAVYVEAGTANQDTVWTLTTNDPNLGTTALVFGQINGGTVPQASTTVQGKVELATQAEAQAKTDTDRAVTPASLADFARKYTQTIGNGSSTSIAVTHGLGTQWVTAQVFDASTNLQIECDVTLTSSTQTTFDFSVAPTTNQYRVVITG